LPHASISSLWNAGGADIDSPSEARLNLRVSVAMHRVHQPERISVLLQEILPEAQEQLAKRLAA
jgi:hypothetical protein